jgi:hypothetical protein
MGTSTKAIIRKGTELSDIKKVLESKYGKVEINTMHNDYFFCAYFNDGGSDRSLNIFYSNVAKNDYGIDGVLLDLGCWNNSVDIMMVLLNEFGGYIDKNDCDDIGFEPINIKAFKQSKDFTKLDEFSNKIISNLGYDNLSITLELFEEYKKLA